MDLAAAAKRVYLDTLRAIEPDSVIKRKVLVDRSTLTIAGEEIRLEDFSEVVLVGIGKASIKMGAAVESLLGDRVKRGILVTDRRSKINVRSEVIVAGHPLPNANSVLAGARVVELVQSCGDDALIVFLISGGGSSLVELPSVSTISLEDLRVTNQLLIGCGATISEINIVRKSLSLIKGGKLGKLARNSTCIGLYFSDVNPGDLRSIASNPLLPEDISVQAVLEVVNRFNLLERLPDSVASAILLPSVEGPARDRGPVTARALTTLLLDNFDAVQSAAELARQLGFRVEIDTELIEGEYQNIADQSIGHLLSLRDSFPNERVCVISGGEVSCAVHGSGIGGRNQEFVLYCAAQLASSQVGDAAVLSCGTDGIDGNSTAAGAVACAQLVINADQRGADASVFISDNDSNSFFRKAGGIIVTGPTGNNIRDLRILMCQ